MLSAIFYCLVSRDSVINIVSCYGLDGRGSNFSGGEIFRTRPDGLSGPPSLLYVGIAPHYRGQSGQCVAFATHQNPA